MMYDKIKKFTIVIFLTLLIWAWAYLSLEEEITESATLNISPMTSPALFVRFNVDTPVRLGLTIKGSASKIADLRKRLRAEDTDKDKEALDFYYNVEMEKKDEPGTYILDLLSFLNKSEKMKKFGLTVESCEIKSGDTKSIEVMVEKLVEQLTAVQCLDESGVVVEHETMEPARVKMFVREGYSGPAKVTLTRQQIIKAREFPIVETPYIELPADKPRFATVRVKIKLPSMEAPVRILQPTIGYIFSKNLQGKYNVELLNESELTSATRFKATEIAWSIYKDKTPYHVFVEVRDGDENAEEEVLRKVIYNFPPEYAEKGEIKLNEPHRQAKFKLTPVPVGSVGP
jgi:hypothetical protein